MLPGTHEDPPALVSRVESLATCQLTPCGIGSMVWRVWGEGRPLVLLHGASGSWTHWIPAVRARIASIYEAADEVNITLGDMLRMNP